MIGFLAEAPSVLTTNWYVDWAPVYAPLAVGVALGAAIWAFASRQVPAAMHLTDDAPAGRHRPADPDDGPPVAVTAPRRVVTRRPTTRGLPPAAAGQPLRRTVVHKYRSTPFGAVAMPPSVWDGPAVWQELTEPALPPLLAESFTAEWRRGDGAFVDGSSR